MGAANLKKLREMSTGMTPLDESVVCETCAPVKIKEVPHKGNLARGTYNLEILHIDCSGPFRTTGADGERHWFTIVDGRSGNCWAIPINNKSEVFPKLRQFLDSEETREHRCRHIHLDQAGEHVAGLFKLFCLERGITLCYTDTDQHQSNGIAERYNRTLQQWLNSVLERSDLPRKYWPIILTKAIVPLVNYCPNDRLGMTCYEAYNNEVPDISYLRIIGAYGYYLQPPNKRPGKIDGPPSIRVRLLGYKGARSYVCLDPATHKVFTANNVIWDETNHSQQMKLRLKEMELAIAQAMNPAKKRSADNDDALKPASKHRREPSDPPGGVRFSELPEIIPISPRVPNPTSQQRSPVQPALRPTPQPSAHQSAQALAAEAARTAAVQQQRPQIVMPNGGADSITVNTDALNRHPVLQPRRSARLNPDMDYIQLLAHHDDEELVQLFTESMEYTAELAQESIEPASLSEALSLPNWKTWQNAMRDEFDSLVHNQTWTLVPRAVGRRVIPGKWVYKLKRGTNGEILRYKARWVIKGFRQEQGIDYHETFASVVKPMSYKALFAVAAALNLEIHQMDVKTAFLYGAIDTEIYMEQPPGLGPVDDNYVCKLNKAIYGLKQSPRIWYNTLSEYLKSIGFHSLFADSGVFVRDHTYIAVYVDDLLIAGPTVEEVSQVKADLNAKFHMTDLGECSYYLGMSIKRNRSTRTIRLGQKAYIEKILAEFDFTGLNPVRTPMDATLPTPSPEDYTADPDLRTLYARQIGSLMYAMLGTRPDIAFAVSFLSRHMSNPTEEHLKAVKRVFRYLKGTMDYELVYQGDLKPVVGYTDADYGADPSTRRSTSGYVFNVGSAPISWMSKRQTVVALSNCEAELMAMTQGAKEAVWLRVLLEELGAQQGKVAATILYGDNQPAIAMSKDTQYHNRAKHIGIQHFYVREVQSTNQIEVKYISTMDMVADGLTKPLPRPAFERFRDALFLFAPRNAEAQGYHPQQSHRSK